MTKPFYFSFGEAICIREILNQMHPISRLQRPIDLKYSNDEGEKELIELVWQYIYDTVEMPYNHIIITPGCIPAVNASMRVLTKLRDSKQVAIHRDSFYYYKNMIEKAGLEAIHYTDLNTVGISDSPSNPYGTYCNIAQQSHNIWDSVYYSPTFINGFHMPPGHVINCGSFSKSLGLTGLRIGYIATNDDNLAKLLREEVKYEYCTVSMLAQTYLTDILRVLYQDRFFLAARGSVNHNREEVSRLEYMLNAPMSTDGMFYVGHMDASAERIFNAAGVEWTNLPSGKVRLNLAQNNQLTKSMVDTVLRIDGK